MFTLHILHIHEIYVHIQGLPPEYIQNYYESIKKNKTTMYPITQGSISSYLPMKNKNACL